MDASTDPNALVFLFHQNRVLVCKSEVTINIPLLSDIQTQSISWKPTVKFGEYRGLSCYFGEIEDPQLPESMEFHEIRWLFDRIDEELFKRAAQAFHLVNWDRTSRYCGRCGSDTAQHDRMLAKICPACGDTIFPRISPAIIVAICKGNQLLLARAQGRDFHGLVAGFIEPGETLEDGLRREVREEVGIEVRNIRYFGSQPWPFPDSLMVGFTAEYESGEITLQDGEIAEADWFTVDRFPKFPSRISIAGHLIEAFIEKVKKASEE